MNRRPLQDSFNRRVARQLYNTVYQTSARAHLLQTELHGRLFRRLARRHHELHFMHLAGRVN